MNLMRKKAEENISGEPPKSLDRHQIPKEFGDLIAADHIVNLDEEEVSLDGDLYACILGDKGTYFMGCEPAPGKTAQDQLRHCNGTWVREKKKR